ncbi:MAG: M67 family metallopeptidase [Roseiflexaceae bacterium]
MITITAEARQAIVAHAEATYPDECVGLLLGRIEGDRKIVTATYPTENRWEGQVALSEQDNAHSRRDRFYLDPRDYLRADRTARAQGLDVVGCYHSHPDHPAVPSERDRIGAQGVGAGSSFAFVIQSVSNGSATALASWLLADEGERFVAEELTDA